MGGGARAHGGQVCAKWPVCVEGSSWGGVQTCPLHPGSCRTRPGAAVLLSATDHLHGAALPLSPTGVNPFSGRSNSKPPEACLPEEGGWGAVWTQVGCGQCPGSVGAPASPPLCRTLTGLLSPSLWDQVEGLPDRALTPGPGPPQQTHVGVHTHSAAPQPVCPSASREIQIRLRVC